MNARQMRRAREAAKKMRFREGLRNRAKLLLDELVREADVLAAQNPAVIDGCQIVRGYVELFDNYKSGAFPWTWVRRTIARMRKTPHLVGGNGSGSFVRSVHSFGVTSCSPSTFHRDPSGTTES